MLTTIRGTRCWRWSVCIVGLIIVQSVCANRSDQPAFDEIQSKHSASPLKYLQREETLQLAYRQYTPDLPPKAVLIFYHSTGTHSAISYPDFAHNISETYPIAVITPDMRGHGYSGGTRGDSPSQNIMYEDVNSHIKDAHTRFPNLPVFLGGHSSGAGLVINHSSYEQALPVDGYVFLSPYMGAVAKVMRDGVQSDFIKIDFQAFANNANHGTDAHTPAIFYNFPPSVLNRYPKIVPALTVEMSLATNAQWPYHQLRDIQKPVALWVGENDEGLDPNKLTYFFTNANEQAHTKVMPKHNHLTVIGSAHKEIGRWLINTITLQSQ